MTGTTRTLAKARAGRKPKQIDWRAVEEAAKICCTHEELAAIAGVCVETLQTACKRDLDLDFSEWIGQKRAFGKISLRRAQYQAVMRGNVTIMIWLGKQWLGQRDKPELSAGDTQPIYIVTNLPGMCTTQGIRKKEESAT